MEAPKKTHSQLNHRFYENEFPDEKDTVIVEIIDVEEIGLTVMLLEYAGIEGTPQNSL